MHDKDAEFMDQAIEEAYNGIRKHDGGPFGSVVVKEGIVVGKGHNEVLGRKDPTCHGEMMAIRDACKNLGTHDLSGCVIYTTAEPCPMCLGAILWANIKTVYYGCNRIDSASIGFRDDDFYETLAGKNDNLEIKEKERESCLNLFDDYAKDQSNKRYQTLKMNDQEVFDMTGFTSFLKLE